MRLPLLSALLATTLCTAGATVQQRRRQPPSSQTTPAGSYVVEERGGEGAGGSTLLKIEPMPVESPAAAGTRLAFAAQFARAEGETAAPQYVSIFFYSHSPRCSFPAQADLRLVISGVPLDLKFQPDSSKTVESLPGDPTSAVTVFAPKAEGVLWVSNDTEGAGCSESLAASVAPQTLARIASARAVEAKVGTTSFRLTAKHLAALRELAARAGVR